MNLNYYFPNYIQNGIFTFLDSLNVPWKTKNITQSLNITYHGNHSGNKEVSPLVDSLVVQDAITDQDRTMLAMAIYSIFSDKWDRLYNILSLQYDPIQNYKMEETENLTGTNKNIENVTSTINSTNNGTETNKGTNTITGTDNDTTESTITDEETTTNSTQVENSNYLFGFNSATAVDSDSQSGTENVNGSIKNNHSDNIKRTRTNDNSENIDITKTINNTGDSKDVRDGTLTGNKEENRTLTRQGNIGVTTSQQMITSEIELWQWNFFDSVFKDIDTMLTIQTY